MTLIELKNNFPILNALYNKSVSEFISLYNNAYDSIAGKFTLHPCALLCTLDGLHNLTGSTHLDEHGNQLRIKEVIDIIAENYAEYAPDETQIVSPLHGIGFKLSNPSGTVYKHRDLIYGDSGTIVIVLAYVYPYASFVPENALYELTAQYLTNNPDLMVSPTLSYALVAKMHSLYFENNGSISLSSAYEDLCSTYINMYNSYQFEPHIKSYTESFTVKPYAIAE